MTTTTEFVPPDLDATRWDEIEPLFESLRDRGVGHGRGTRGLARRPIGVRRRLQRGGIGSLHQYDLPHRGRRGPERVLDLRLGGEPEAPAGIVRTRPRAGRSRRAVRARSGSVRRARTRHAGGRRAVPRRERPDPDRADQARPAVRADLRRDDRGVPRRGTHAPADGRFPGGHGPGAARRGVARGRRAAATRRRADQRDIRPDGRRAGPDGAQRRVRGVHRVRVPIAAPVRLHARGPARRSPTRASGSSCRWRAEWTSVGGNCSASTCSARGT